MYRTLVSALLLAAASTGANAQDKPATVQDAKATADAPAKPRARNAFSQAISDLMQAAREQHDAQAAKATRAAGTAASPGVDTHRPAPALADSGPNTR